MTDVKMHMGHPIDAAGLEDMRSWVIAHGGGKSYLGRPIPAPTASGFGAINTVWALGGYVALADAYLVSIVLRPVPEGLKPERTLLAVSLMVSARTVLLCAPTIEPLADVDEGDLAELMLLRAEADRLRDAVRELRTKGAKPDLRVVSRLPDDLPKAPR